METLLGTCVNEDLIDDLFGSVSEFACLVEDNGDNFVHGNIVIRYDEDSDTHSFYLKDHNE